MGTSHDFLVGRQGVGYKTIQRQNPNSHTFLPSAKPAEVKRIHQWCPQQLQTKWPKDKTEEGLVRVADFLSLQDQRNTTSQSQRNPL